MAMTPNELCGQIDNAEDIKVHSVADDGPLESTLDTSRNPLSLQHEPARSGSGILSIFLSSIFAKGVWRLGPS